MQLAIVNTINRLTPLQTMGEFMKRIQSVIVVTINKATKSKAIKLYQPIQLVIANTTSRSLKLSEKEKQTMTTITIENEILCCTAQQLGHHQNLNETIEKALEKYVQYLQQQEIMKEFGTVDFSNDYDYKQQRKQL